MAGGRDRGLGGGRRPRHRRGRRGGWPATQQPRRAREFPARRSGSRVRVGARRGGAQLPHRHRAPELYRTPRHGGGSGRARQRSDGVELHPGAVRRAQGGGRPSRAARVRRARQADAGGRRLRRQVHALRAAGGAGGARGGGPVAARPHPPGGAARRHTRPRGGEHHQAGGRRRRHPDRHCRRSQVRRRLFSQHAAFCCGADDRQSVPVPEFRYPRRGRGHQQALQRRLPGAGQPPARVRAGEHAGRAGARAGHRSPGAAAAQRVAARRADGQRSAVAQHRHARSAGTGPRTPHLA